MRRFINTIACMICLFLFLLPIAAIGYYHRAAKEAEARHEEAMRHHQREMDRIVRDSHVRSR